jgi:DNA-binding response OmpR family regulator
MSRILVIDDDQAVRGAMQLLLQADGFEVIAASDGESGIAAATATTPDLAIIDLFMPGLSGVDTIKAFRERHPGVPIIAVSGVMPSSGGVTQSLDTAAEFGADLTLHKPFRPQQLMAAVKQALGAFEPQR